MAYINPDDHELLEVRYTITREALLDASYEEWTVDQLARAIARLIQDYSLGDLDKSNFYRWERDECFIKYRLFDKSERLTYVQIIRILPKRKLPRNFGDVIAVGKELTLEVVKTKINKLLEA